MKEPLNKSRTKRFRAVPLGARPSKAVSAQPPWNMARAKARMTALRLNQTDLARLLGYTKAAVSHWFRGRGIPSMADIHRIADALDITTAELLSDDYVEIAVGEAQRKVVRLMKHAPAEDQAMVLAIVQAALQSRNR